MDYEQMQEMVKTHCCAQCSGALVVIWDATKSDHALVCGVDHSHQGYTEIGTFATQLARGQADKKLGPGGQSEMERQLAKVKHPLSTMPKSDLGSGKELSEQQLTALNAWGVSLDLKPYLGHVCLYYGKPYVTIDGFYYNLASKESDVRVGTRPLTQKERASYQIPDGAHAWLAEAWIKGEKLPTTGLGVVTSDEILGKSEKNQSQWRAPVVHAHPQRMAEKRAEWQLLRKLVPLEEVRNV
jgi:hypothetical protein